MCFQGKLNTSPSSPTSPSSFGMNAHSPILSKGWLDCASGPTICAADAKIQRLQRAQDCSDHAEAKACGESNIKVESSQSGPGSALSAISDEFCKGRIRVSGLEREQV